MRIEAAHGAVLFRLGKRFSTAEAERLHEAAMELQPLTQLTLDFTDVREFHDSALLPLSRTLRELSAPRIVFRGLTLHHTRILRYFGLGDGPAAQA